MQSADNPGMLTSEQIALMNLAQEANNNKETNNGRGYLDPNTSQAPQHHTLGQMAERFQERARTESQQKPADGASNSGDDDGADDYDDDDDEEDDEEGGKAVARGNESTGRWTRAEHDLFVKALKLYGKVRSNPHSNDGIHQSYSPALLCFSLYRNLLRTLGVEESGEYG